MAERYELGAQRSQGLVDILDRILDRGLVVAGDIRIRLADVELLTIQVRLLICSIDKAAEIGMAWWRTDPFFGGGDADRSLPEGSASETLASLDEKLDRLDERLAALEKRKRDG